MSMSHMNDLPELWAVQNAKSKGQPSTRPTNHAAWQKERCGPLIVDEAPLPEPGPGQILVKVAAIAMNPADWAVRDMGILVPQWPVILGCEAAGTVVAVDERLKSVKPGDRVFGFSMFVQHGVGHGAFQEYAIMDWPAFGKTPDNISDPEAATITIGAATAGDGLFRGLGLGLPQSTRTKPKGETVIVWGGSTSVGASGIQMLVAAGYDVVTTASPRNFDFCKSLGAIHVSDYNRASIVEELLEAVKGRKVSGALAAMSTEQSVDALCRVVSITPNAVKHVISVFPGLERDTADGLKVSMAECTTVCHSELGVYLWGHFLPDALANGKMKAKPEPNVVGHGIESVVTALDTLKAGVSATKIVVTL